MHNNDYPVMHYVTLVEHWVCKKHCSCGEITNSYQALITIVENNLKSVTNKIQDISIKAGKVIK